MEERNCPYCQGKVTNDIKETKNFVHFLIIKGSNAGLEELEEDLRPVEDRRYKMFCDTRQIQISEEKIRRCIKTREEMDKIAQKVREEQLDIEEFEMQEDERNNSYFYEIREEGGGKAISKMVCPHCHCVLPKIFFRYPFLSLGLIGNSDAGKTVLMLCLMDRLLRLGSVECPFIFKEVFSENEDEFLAQKKALMNQLFRDGHIVDSTPQGFQFPLLWQVISRNDKNQRCLLALYDISAENLVRATEGDVILEYLKNLYGYIFMIDSEQTALWKFGGEFWNDENMEILKKGTGRLEYGKDAYTSDRSKVTIGEILRQKVGKSGIIDSSEQIRTQKDVQNNGEGTQETRKSRWLTPAGLLQVLEGAIGNEDILLEQHMAAVLAQADKLSSNKIINDMKNRSGLKRYDGLKNSEGMDYRKELCKEIFMKYIPEVWNYCDVVYKHTDYFMISVLREDSETVRLTKEKKKYTYEPVLPEEPLITLVSAWIRGNMNG